MLTVLYPSPKACACGGHTRVTDSRQREDRVTRRYACQCGARWSTIELRVEELERQARASVKEFIATAIERLQALL